MSIYDALLISIGGAAIITLILNIPSKNKQKNIYVYDSGTQIQSVANLEINRTIHSIPIAAIIIILAVNICGFTYILTRGTSRPTSVYHTYDGDNGSITLHEDGTCTATGSTNCTFDYSINNDGSYNVNITYFNSKNEQVKLSCLLYSYLQCNTVS